MTERKQDGEITKNIGLITASFASIGGMFGAATALADNVPVGQVLANAGSGLVQGGVIGAVATTSALANMVLTVPLCKIFGMSADSDERFIYTGASAVAGFVGGTLATTAIFGSGGVGALALGFGFAAVPHAIAGMAFGVKKLIEGAIDGVGSLVSGVFSHKPEGP